VFLILVIAILWAVIYNIKSNSNAEQCEGNIKYKELINEIKRDEGKRTVGGLHVMYIDSLGHPTIGWGRKISEPSGLTDDEAEFLLGNDIARIVAELDRRLPWWRDESELRQRALVNMAFQLGVSGLLGFKKMLMAMQAGMYKKAAQEALDSLWAKQTPTRAERIAKMIEQGYNDE